MDRVVRGRLAAAGVTRREAEVLELLGRRLRNREIADRLNLSVRTVESHISALLRKLGADERRSLIELAQILMGEPRLPHPTTPLVGREAQLAQLAGVLADCRFVCLTGPAGSGKSRLALEAAQCWQGEARIAELSSAAADEIALLIGATLGLGRDAGDAVAAARIALLGRDMLLVVDNCDHVVEEAAIVLTRLVQGVPDLHVLATSRQPIGVGAETFPVPPLDVPVGSSAAEVRVNAACQLFLTRARAASPGFRLDDTSARYVALICRRSDGLPMVIELAAGCVGQISLGELADGLDPQLPSLVSTRRAGRHESLSAAIECSWRLLSDTERDLLSRLAVLPGEFTVRLAEAIGTGPPELTRTSLIRMVERSMVSVLRLGEEPTRYGILETIRSFAARHIKDQAAERVLRAHAQFWCDTSASAVLDQRDPASGAAVLSTSDETNILSALSWSARHESAIADRLLTSVGYLTQIGPSRRAIETIRDAVHQHPDIWSSEALAHAGLAVTYMDLDGAQRLAELSRDRARSPRDAAYSLWVEGWVHGYRGNEPEALRCLDQVIGYAESAADAWLLASARQGRGMSRVAVEEAIDDLERAIIPFLEVGDLKRAFNVRYMMAARAVEAGIRLSDVGVWLDECETYVTTHGYWHELAHVRLTRAQLERAAGELRDAPELLDQALPVFQRAGDFRCVTRALVEQAVHVSADDPARSTRLLVQALTSAAVASGSRLSANVLAELVRVAAAAGQPVLASRALGALEALTSAPGGRALDADVLEALRGPTYETFLNEGRAGGIDLLTALYAIPADRAMECTRQ